MNAVEQVKLNKNKKSKAYVLMSGGLDSTLAAKMLLDQGVDVTGVYISTGFCVNAQQKRNGRFDESKPDVFKVTEELGIDLEVIDISQEYIGIVANPKYGWGKNVNPCIDCRIHMLKKTRELMEQNYFDFIATGEVVGQRPMSQKKNTALLIEEKSGLQGRLLRPLSAKFFNPTIPETEGLVDRELLGSLNGRNRKPQLAMAKKYQIKNAATPAGGCCYLTDENYGVRFKDLLIDRRKLLSSDDSLPLTHEDMIVLSMGRQIKIRTGLKFIAGRNEQENKLMAHYRSHRILMETTHDTPGPIALIDNIPDENMVVNREEFSALWNQPVAVTPQTLSLLKEKLPEYNPDEVAFAASLLARYSDAKHKSVVEIKIDTKRDNVEGEIFTIFAAPCKDESRLQTRLIVKYNEKYFLS